MSKRGRGGLFFREAEEVTANVLLKKLRADGRLSDTAPRSLDGFGPLGEVGLAIHEPKNGWWAVIDSADGAAGIGAGESSTPAIMANHLGSTALWYRVFSKELALAVELARGGSFFRVVVGTDKHVNGWVKAFGCPTGAAAPKDVGAKVKLATIAYDEATYRSGPSESCAEKLFVLRQTIEGGETTSVHVAFAALRKDEAPLGLALLRALGAAPTFAALAEEILAKPTVPRGRRVGVLTFGEEVLRRVAETTSDFAMFERCLERLDAIESEAESRSAHAYTAGVERVAGLAYGESKGRAFECYRRLIARDDSPAWHHVNLAIATLLESRQGALAMEGEVAEVARRAEARLPDLGPDAKFAIEYNLACLYARAGQSEDALDHLERCGDLTKQNAQPESDTDLASVWQHPRFRALLLSGDEDRDEGEVEANKKESWIVPSDRAIPRLDLAFHKGGDEAALSSRMGGLPSAPKPDSPWPSTVNRPMDFILQLTGKAGGGDLDMGDIQVLQVFAEIEGDYYEQNEVVVHREPCPVTLELPLGVDPAPAQAMTFEPGSDDRVLTDLEWPDEGDSLYEAHRSAYSHAFVDKAFGIPVGGNLEPEYITDSAGVPMRCLLQLVSHDEWFLWYVFASADFREVQLVVIR